MEQKQSIENILKGQDLTGILSSQWNLGFMLKKRASYEKQLFFDQNGSWHNDNLITQNAT